MSKFIPRYTFPNVQEPVISPFLHRIGGISPARPLPLTGVSGSKRRGGEGLLEMSASSPIPLAEAGDDPDVDPAKGPGGVLRGGAAAAEVDKSPESNKSWSASPLLLEEGD